jgi:hypothetical protein
MSQRNNPRAPSQSKGLRLIKSLAVTMILVDGIGVSFSIDADTGHDVLHSGAAPEYGPANVTVSLGSVSVSLGSVCSSGSGTPASGKVVNSLQKVLEDLGDMSELDALALQMAMDSRSQLTQMLSNIEKTFADTQASITQNIKA